MKTIWKVLAALLLMIPLAGCEKKEPAAEMQTAETEVYADRKLPYLYSDYVYLEDMDSHQVIIDQRSQERMYPASMTKMMTAILAIENIPDPESTIITFTDEMLEGLVEAHANRAGFNVGDAPSALDCIYGDLLPSGADCSRALAFYIAGSEEDYVEMMNAKAAELGMNHTHFVNTSGLHDDDHYTTCRDMAVLFEYCYQNELFRKILMTRSYHSIPVLHYPKGLWMSNYVLMYLDEYDPKYKTSFSISGFLGGKSGYTVEGQYTLASACEINGRRYVLVNGHGYVQPHYPASIDDASRIYRWVRDHLNEKTIIHSGDVYGSVPVRNSSNGIVNAAAAEDVVLDAPSDDNIHLVIHLDDTVDAPVYKDQKIGSVDVYLYRDLVKNVDLVSKEAVDSDLSGRMHTWMDEHPVEGIVVILAAATLAVILTKRRKKR